MNIYKCGAPAGFPREERNDDMLLIPIDDFTITIYDKDRDEVREGVSSEIIDYMTDP